MLHAAPTKYLNLFCHEKSAQSKSNQQCGCLTNPPCNLVSFITKYGELEQFSIKHQIVECNTDPDVMAPECQYDQR